MAPQFMALMQVMFQPVERISKLAMFGVIGGLAAIIGPIIGGLLIEANAFGLGWRLIFWLIFLRTGRETPQEQTPTAPSRVRAR